MIHRHPAAPRDTSRACFDIFGGGKPPAPQPIPAAPIADPNLIKQQQDAAEAERLRAAGGGRASTILTGGLGDPGYGKNSVAKTLGAG